MKPGGPLTRKTPISRGGPLPRTGQLARGEGLQRGGPLRPRSERMSKLYREERVPLVAAFLEARPWCEFPRGCSSRSESVHELVKRSAGGSIVDEVNLRASCLFHNGWAEDNPDEAVRIGWVVRRKPLPS